MAGLTCTHKDGPSCAEMTPEVPPKKPNWCLCRGLSSAVTDRRACRSLRPEHWQSGSCRRKHRPSARTSSLWCSQTGWFLVPSLETNELTELMFLSTYFWQDSGGQIGLWELQDATWRKSLALILYGGGSADHIRRGTHSNRHLLVHFVNTSGQT